MGRTGERPERRTQRRRGHGEGSIYQRKDGMWVAVATIGRTAEGRQKRKYIYDRKYEEARRKLKAVLNELDAGKPGEHDQGFKALGLSGDVAGHARKRLAPESGHEVARFKGFVA